MASNSFEPSASYRYFGEVKAGVASKPCSSSARTAAWSWWCNCTKSGNRELAETGAGTGVALGAESGIFSNVAGPPALPGARVFIDGFNIPAVFHRGARSFLMIHFFRPGAFKALAACAVLAFAGVG